ncbi:MULTISPECIES: Fic/DOC family protein [Gordonia]|uniref:protein adenylyltransferase n=1 Tax=Gordonia sihwensis NBRC 108236 TaxID=1223544 RepID=L7LQF7_9ACTN|nr:MULTISPECIES: Fic family protein [Gordonia]AUH70537.1 cell filamentation protein Fic [Gordonia sp. YC-JH1]WFN95106.1 Fic family protein [Gordonia sihwensis]GAC62323.1 hypothetical protein GSI01S_33_00090 [Gordonia sihwensis NBRC 108236]
MSTEDPNDIEVPANKVGASTVEELEAVERLAAAKRIIELDSYDYLDRDDYDPGLRPEVLTALEARRFDVSYLQAIHAYILQDVYDWSGQLRVAGQHTFAMGIKHAPPEVMRQHLPLLESDIALDRPDLDTPAQQALETAAHHWSQMTYLHPFVDGNSRSQRVFFNEYLRDAGWDIDWNKVDAGAVHAARHVSLVFNDPTYLAAQLDRGLVGFGDPAAVGSLGELMQVEYARDKKSVEDIYLAMFGYAEEATADNGRNGYTFIKDYAAAQRPQSAAERAARLASRGTSRTSPTTQSSRSNPIPSSRPTGSSERSGWRHSSSPER